MRLAISGASRRTGQLVTRGILGAGARSDRRHPAIPEFRNELSAVEVEDSDVTVVDLHGDVGAGLSL
jgi:hypothetical protein